MAASKGSGGVQKDTGGDGKKNQEEGSGTVNRQERGKAAGQWGQRRGGQRREGQEVGMDWNNGSGTSGGMNRRQELTANSIACVEQSGKSWERVV